MSEFVLWYLLGNANVDSTKGCIILLWGSVNNEKYCKYSELSTGENHLDEMGIPSVITLGSTTSINNVAFNQNLFRIIPWMF